MRNYSDFLSDDRGAYTIWLLIEWSTSGTPGTFRINQLDRERLNIERQRAALQMQRERRRRQPGYPVTQRGNETDPEVNASTRHLRTRAPSTDT